MNQDTFDIIEISTLIAGCVINLATLICLWIYAQKTYSIAQSTRETSSEAALMAKITEDSFEISTKILNEMRETRDAQEAPYVFAYFDHFKGKNATTVYLVIKNAGKGIAENVQVIFTPELQNDGSFSLHHIKQIISNVPPLPPGGELRHAFAFTIKYFNAEPLLPQQYKVRISFYGGVKKTERIVEQEISLNFFQGLRINTVGEK